MLLDFEAVHRVRLTPSRHLGIHEETKHTRSYVPSPAPGLLHRCVEQLAFKLQLARQVVQVVGEAARVARNPQP
jgi:hypothetical protein